MSAPGPNLTVIDAHIHLWDLNKLRYGWLTDGYTEGMLPIPYKPICRDYLIEEFITETRSSGVEGAVHIQAALDHPDPVEETQWLQQCADRAGFPLSIVGSADLRSPELEEVLDRHGEYSRFCGVRMLRVDSSTFADADYRKGLKILGQRELVYDLDVQWPSMDAAASLARDFPNLLFIVNHAGFPTERTPEYFNNWQRGMKHLAEPENVLCKISGLGMYDPYWTVDSIKPWVEHTLDCFGVSRCMLGSNWPLDSLFSSYAALIDAYKTLLEGYSQNDVQALAYSNALNFYRVDMSAARVGSTPSGAA
jgi:predicted TIM-barrel fold metal-dependent hydrolase